MYALQTNVVTSAKSNNSDRMQWLKVIFGTVFMMALLLLVAIEPAFAGPASTGGTGSAATAAGRVSAVAIGFQGILLGAGTAILSAAFLYVGYGMVWGGKQWKDVANVAYGALIAGMGTMLVGWLFS